MSTSGRKLLEKDQFAQYIGIELLMMEDGCAETRIQIQDHHLNGLGIVQGGMIFTLADYTLACAANSKEEVAIGIQADIHWVKAAKKGVLTATAREASRGRKTASYQVEVVDDQGDNVAIFQGLVFLKKTK